MLLWLLFSIGVGYQLATVFLALRFRRECGVDLEVNQTRFSQVKPVYRPESQTLDAIESFLAQSGVPPHDVYLCSSSPGPSRWLADHPQVTWLRLQAEQERNGKAAVLAKANRYWSGDIFVVSDADMHANPDYLARVLSEFRDLEVGVVTCLYRSTPSRFGDWCHLLEALCILDFSASVLVARETEGMTFAMGSTMAIRRETLAEIGGFEALEPYLADDYQLGNRAHRAGWKVRLASTVLQTEPPKGSLRVALEHQYRWLVTSRVSRPGGHFAFLLTQGFLWAALLCLASSHGIWPLLAWAATRMLCGAVVSRALSNGSCAGLWEAVFLVWKDALFLGLWMLSCFGQRVRWGGRELVIDAEGRIISSRALQS